MWVIWVGSLCRAIKGRLLKLRVYTLILNGFYDEPAIIIMQSIRPGLLFIYLVMIALP